MVTREDINKLNEVFSDDLDNLDLNQCLDVFAYLILNQFYFDEEVGNYPFKDKYHKIVAHLSDKYSVVDKFERHRFYV